MEPRRGRIVREARERSLVLTKRDQLRVPRLVAENPRIGPEFIWQRQDSRRDLLHLGQRLGGSSVRRRRLRGERRWGNGQYDQTTRDTHKGILERKKVGTTWTMQRARGSASPRNRRSCRILSFRSL